jgi:hypothetical protein
MGLFRRSLKSGRVEKVADLTVHHLEGGRGFYAHADGIEPDEDTVEIFDRLEKQHMEKQVEPLDIRVKVDMPGATPRRVERDRSGNVTRIVPDEGVSIPVTKTNAGPLRGPSDITSKREAFVDAVSSLAQGYGYANIEAFLADVLPMDELREILANDPKPARPETAASPVQKVGPFASVRAEETPDPDAVAKSNIWHDAFASRARAHKRATR